MRVEFKGKSELPQSLDDYLERGVSIFDHAESVLIDARTDRGEVLMV